MHMADALVAPAVAGVMAACSMGAAGFSVQKIKREDNDKKIPLMGVMGAFVFAAQMINFTIPGTGSSGHLCGGMMLTALLGPCQGFLTMIGVLLIQCLIFADGGLMALGCNVWNMAFYGCFVGALIWKAIMRQGIDKRKIILASISGCIITLQMGALSVVVETYASGVTGLPFQAFLVLMQPIHLAIGAVEGLITASVLVFIYQARPELFWGVAGSLLENREKKKAIWLVSFIGAGALIVAGGLSLLASEYPDGLEWSILRLTGSTEISGNLAASGGHNLSSAIQKATSLFPDYAFKGSDAAIGTGVAGVAGALLVLLLCVGIAWIFRVLTARKKDTKKDRGM